jgi:hypothetical protein
LLAQRRKQTSDGQKISLKIAVLRHPRVKLSHIRLRRQRPKVVEAENLRKGGRVFVDGRFRVGAVDEVMNSQTLSELYRTEVEVVRIGGQIHVAGVHSAVCEDEPHHTHEQV